MLRLTLVERTDQGAVLKVEGWLAGSEVGLLEAEGRRYLESGRRLVLEVSGVRNIDQAGLALLQRWQGRGVTWQGASFYIEALLTSGGGEPPAAAAGHPEWLLFTPENSGLPTAGVFRIAIDPQDRVWTMCVDAEWVEGHGIARFDGRNWVVYDKRSGLPSDWAAPLAFDAEGHTWIGTTHWRNAEGGEGLVRFDGTNWTVYTTENSPLPANNVWAGALDRRGALWVGTSGGLARLEGERWTVFHKEDTGLSTEWLSSVAVDPQGNVWVGAFQGSGAARFDGQRWTAYTPENSGIMPHAVLHIVFDQQGNAWFGSWGDLVKFDGTNWTAYMRIDVDDGMPGAWGLAVDGQGRVWAGGGGLLMHFASIRGAARFDGTSWKFYRPDNDSGMPARKAYALAPDRHGNVWIGTELGLVVYREGGVILPGSTAGEGERFRV